MRIVNTFSKDEEIANAVSHMMGGILALIGSVAIIYHSITKGSAIHIVSFSIFSTGLIIMYTASSIYHALHQNRAKYIFQIFDHSAIYILIASTYTPFLLLTVRSKAGHIILVIQWTICVLGIVFKSLFVERFVLFSTLLYIVMGWMIVFVWNDLIRNIDKMPLILLFIGGVLYTIGTIFYMWRLFKYHHFIWHIFVLLGSIAHYFAVYQLL